MKLFKRVTAILLCTILLLGLLPVHSYAIGDYEYVDTVNYLIFSDGSRLYLDASCTILGGADKSFTVAPVPDYIPNGQGGAYYITTLAYRSFYGHTKMTGIYLPASITTICAEAFGACSALTDVYYAGTETMWKSVRIAAGNEDLKNARIHYNSKFFRDLDTEAYYVKPVLWAVENGITTGVSATEFAPDRICTRGQIVTFLWRAAGSPEPITAKNPFSDVAAKDYYYKAVLWAVEKGITTGTGKGKFSPEQECTRAQVATFLWRAMGSPVVSSSNNSFSDISAGEYYYTAVLWAVENGITNGTGAGKFSPAMSCTRGQIVTFLYRALS